MISDESTKRNFSSYSHFLKVMAESLINPDNKVSKCWEPQTLHNPPINQDKSLEVRQTIL